MPKIILIKNYTKLEKSNFLNFFCMFSASCNQTQENNFFSRQLYPAVRSRLLFPPFGTIEARVKISSQKQYLLKKLEQLVRMR